MAHETPESWLYHVGDVPCRWFNKYTIPVCPVTHRHVSGCINGAACTYGHAPNHQSLRLDVAGPNICEGFLVRIGGCERGPNCIYSHDLEHGAGLPVDDADALRETLEYFVRLRKDQRRAVSIRGSVVKAWGGGPPCLNMRGKCGDTLLRELGGSRPGDGAPPVPDSDAVLMWRLADEQAPGSQPFPHADRSRLQQERMLLRQAINRSPGVKKTKKKSGASKAKAKAELVGKSKQRREAARDPPPPPPPRVKSPSYSLDAEDAWQTELEEREENFGWTADEHDGLASQGIKPWELEDSEAYFAFDPRRSP